jgi:hypothetical protein
MAHQRVSRASATQKQAKIREAAFEDYEQIASLESRYGLEVRDFGEWSHLWLGNPLYQELPDWPIGWVLEDENRRIVGSVGNIPLPYEFEGKRILAVSGRAQVAEPAYRGATLLLLDRLINQSRVDLYVNNTMTAEAEAGFSVFECPRVPVGVWNQSSFWITGYQGFVESLLTMKKWPAPKLLSYPLSAFSFLRDALTKRPWAAASVEVKLRSNFDERFDVFWERLRVGNPRSLLAVRNRQVLRWHFRHALLSNSLWIATVDQGAHIAAYAIFDRRDNQQLGLKRARLVDFRSLDGTTTLLPPLISWALKKCRDEDIHILENVGRCLEEGDVIAKLAFYRRKLSAWTFFYRANNPAFAESLKDPRCWSPSLYDGNASL